MDMITNLIGGFATALSGYNLFFLAFGGMVGTIVGAFPGLSAPTAIALLLPMTFTLDPTTAIITLAGIYYGSLFGNSITAVLLGIPGDSAAVVTSIEGHALSRQGRAGHALTMASVASFAGSTIAAILLMLTAPVLASFALRFGPPEYAAIIVLSFAVLPAFSGGSRSKLLIAVALGFFIATIGIDDHTARSRFTFDTLDLLSGIGFVPAVIGLYGIADVFHLAGQNTGFNAKLQRMSIGNLIPPLRDWMRLRFSAVSASILGFLLGVMPGLGATIASFVGYAVDRSLAKDKSAYGKGEMKGLVASESASSAAAIGSMVPMLTLGIPGSAATAIILGGFLIWGLQPGPMLFARNPDFVWGLIASMYVGSVFLMIVNIVLVPLLILIVRVPQAILGTLIIVFCAVATYSVNLSTFDLWVMLAFGILGYCLRMARIPETPIVLALVLQPILENSFRQSLTMSTNGPLIFLERPLSTAVLALAVIAFAGPPLWAKVKGLRSPGKEDLTSQ